MTDERIPILLTREQWEVVERLVVSHMADLYSRKSLGSLDDDGTVPKVRALFTAIAAQLRAQDAGEGE